MFELTVLPLIGAQNNDIRTSYIKAKIDKSQQNSKCRLWGDRDEMMRKVFHLELSKKIKTWPYEQIIYEQLRTHPGDCPVSWGCRIHWLPLCRGVRPPPNECPGYDTKQSDGEVPAVLELWGMRSTPSLPSLPGPLWPGVVAPDRALSMG